MDEDANLIREAEAYFKESGLAGEATFQVGLPSDLPSDRLAQDVRDALHHLDEITGEVTTDETFANP